MRGGTLYLDRKDLELRMDGAALAFYEGGQKSGSVPLALLDRVVVRGRTVLDTGVLGRLAEARVGLVVLNARHAERVAILARGAHGDAARRIAQYAWHLDTDRRAAVALRVVRAKVAGQMRCLRRALAGRPDQSRALTLALQGLGSALARIKAEPGLGLASLRGIEGAAAAAYFRGYTAVFPSSLEFTGRNRRPPRDPVNACLSLGYTLGHFEAVLACHGAGLDPMIGCFHDLAHGRESLAADLLEPLRPHIDEWVWGLFRERLLRGDHFARHQGACLLGKAGRKLFWPLWEGRARLLRRWLRRVAGRFARDLRAMAADLEEGAP